MVIVGAGPGGAATAVALANLGVSGVLLLDQAPRRPDRAPAEASLPPGSRLLLERLGVWESFLTDGHVPSMGTCSSWGSADLGYNDYLFSPHGTGWHLDRARFDERLVAEARARGVEVRWGTRVTHLEPMAGFGRGVRLRTEDGWEIGARFVVDASGVASVVGRTVGGGRRTTTHRLVGAAAVVSAPGPLGSGALGMLEAVEYGWWYTARLPGERAFVMVATDPAGFRRQRLGTPAGWASCLRRTRHLSVRLGEATEQPPVPLVPLVRSAVSGALRPCAGEDWVGVGDAVASFDPLMGQGVAKALRDGHDAAAAIASGLDGRPDAMAGYRADREALWRDYCRQAASLYRLERRWPDAPFWAAAHAWGAARGQGKGAPLLAPDPRSASPAV